MLNSHVNHPNSTVSMVDVPSTQDMICLLPVVGVTVKMHILNLIDTGSEENLAREIRANSPKRIEKDLTRLRHACRGSNCLFKV